MIISNSPDQTIQVALEPIYNILNSFSLLSETQRLSGLNLWIIQTAATLTPEQHHTHRLIFEGLRDAILPEQDETDFPTYLKHLAEQNSEAVRSQFFERLNTRFSKSSNQTSPDTARLLADRQAFLTCVEYVPSDTPFDAVLQTEVHTLLQDATSMHQMIVVHLEAIWKLFAPEWQRVQARLRWQAEMFAYGLDNSLDEEETVEEAFHTLTGQALPLNITKRLVGDSQVMLVPSWHIGRQVTLWQSDTGTRLFFSEPPNYDLSILHSAPMGRSELRARLAALADDTRLRIVELLMQQDELPAQDIIAALELSQSSVSRHLKQLVATKYLYERRGEGANKTYRLSGFYFERTARALEQLVAETNMPQTATTDEKQSQELRRFLDKSGKLTLWPPAKQRDKLLILEYLASAFEKGHMYSEKEVNALLLLRSTVIDTAALRRALYEYRFMSRTRDGSQYWLIESEDMTKEERETL